MKLKEFIDTNGNQVKIPKATSTVSKGTTSSGGFRKRLYKLIKYHEHHPGPDIEYLSIDSLTEDTITFTEYYKQGNKVNYEIYIGSTTEAWRLKVTEGKDLISDDSGMGWPELLKHLRLYITVPVTGTPEYKDLVFEDSKEDFLKEFVDSKGNKVNLKNSSSSSKKVSNIPDQTYRFERLVAQIKADKLCDIRVHGLTGSVLAFTTDKSVTVRLERKASSHPYILQIGNHADAYTDYDEVLEILIDEGIIANTDLCESASFAEDFQQYENLWD